MANQPDIVVMDKQRRKAVVIHEATTSRSNRVQPQEQIR